MSRKGTKKARSFVQDAETVEIRSNEDSFSRSTSVSSDSSSSSSSSFSSSSSSSSSSCSSSSCSSSSSSSALKAPAPEFGIGEIEIDTSCAESFSTDHQKDDEEDEKEPRESDASSLLTDDENLENSHDREKDFLGGREVPYIISDTDDDASASSSHYRGSTAEKKMAQQGDRLLDLSSGAMNFGPFTCGRCRVSQPRNDEKTFMHFILGRRVIYVDVPLNYILEEKKQVPQRFKEGPNLWELASVKSRDDDEASSKYCKAKKFELMFVKVKGPDITTVDLEDLLSKFGNFAALSARKAASRLELFQSPGCKMNGRYVHELSKDDFVDIEEEGHEGCGFIDEEYLYDLFGRTKKGLPRAEAKRALSLQVRAFVPSKGIYKGMLMKKRIRVGANRNAPPIQLPTSMKKVEASIHPDRSDKGYLLVCAAGKDPSSTCMSMKKWLEIGDSTMIKEKRPKEFGPMIKRLLEGLDVPERKLHEYCREANWNGAYCSHAYLRGVADPTGKIPPNHVFITGLNRPIESSDNIFITRDPCVKVTDGCLIKVMTEKPDNMSQHDYEYLKSMHFGNVIFAFPNSGCRPAPTMIADGDLDGDRYFLFWNEEILKHIQANVIRDERLLQSSDIVSKDKDKKTIRSHSNGRGWLDEPQKIMLNPSRAEVDALIGIFHGRMLKQGGKGSKERHIEDPDAEAFADAYKEALNNGKHGTKIMLPVHLWTEIDSKLHRHLVPTGRTYAIGTRVRKYFPRHEKFFNGRVEKYDQKENWYTVRYDDDDTEELTHLEIMPDVTLGKVYKELKPGLKSKEIDGYYYYCTEKNDTPQDIARKHGFHASCITNDERNKNWYHPLQGRTKFGPNCLLRIDSDPEKSGCFEATIHQTEDQVAATTRKRKFNRFGSCVSLMKVKKTCNSQPLRSKRKIANEYDSNTSMVDAVGIASSRRARSLSTADGKPKSTSKKAKQPRERGPTSAKTPLIKRSRISRIESLSKSSNPRCTASLDDSELPDYPKNRRHSRVPRNQVSNKTKPKKASAASATEDFRIGTKLVKHVDSVPYTAKVAAIENGTYFIQYEDGDEDFIDREELSNCVEFNRIFVRKDGPKGSVYLFSEFIAYYFSQENDTPRLIAKKFGCRTKDITKNASNQEIYPSLTLDSKLKGKTMIQLDIVKCNMQKLEKFVTERHSSQSKFQFSHESTPTKSTRPPIRSHVVTPMDDNPARADRGSSQDCSSCIDFEITEGCSSEPRRSCSERTSSHKRNPLSSQRKTSPTLNRSKDKSVSSCVAADGNSEAKEDENDLTFVEKLEEIEQFFKTVKSQEKWFKTVKGQVEEQITS